MPQLARLATFRGADAKAKLSEGRQRTYQRMFRFPYWSAALVWLGLAGVSCWLSRSSRTFYFTVAVVGSGALLLFFNIALTEYEDRYTLPLWALLLTAILLHAGQCLENRGRRRSSPTPRPRTDTATPT